MNFAADFPYSSYGSERKLILSLDSLCTKEIRKWKGLDFNAFFA